MKRIVSLAFFCLLAVALRVSAGPERIDAKSVVQPAPAMCDWTGFYLGIQGGWRGGETEWQEPDDSSTVFRQDIHGGFGGLELGYNHQFGNWFVIGVELSGTYGTPDDNSSVRDGSSNDVLRFGTQEDWGGTFALRAGFTSLNNKLFLYAKGGGAVTHWNYDYVNDETLSNTTPGAGFHRPEFDRWHEGETRVSPLAGAGLEYAVTCHWTVKAEWNRTFLGEERVTGVLHEDPSPRGIEADDPKHAYDIDLTQDSAMIGLNYKF